MRAPAAPAPLAADPAPGTERHRSLLLLLLLLAPPWAEAGLRAAGLGVCGRGLAGGGAAAGTMLLAAPASSPSSRASRGGFVGAGAPRAAGC